MPSRKQNCPFCDSPHHVAFDCFNSLNGRRVILDKCMMSQEIPDFQSYTKKELKLVAYITPYKDTMARISGKRYSGYDPISLTLSKSRLVERLIDRWNTLEAMRHTYYRPPHGEECPICYENLDPFVPRAPPHLLKYDLTSATVRLLLFVAQSTNTAIPFTA